MPLLAVALAGDAAHAADLPASDTRPETDNAGASLGGRHLLRPALVSSRLAGQQHGAEIADPARGSPPIAPLRLGQALRELTGVAGADQVTLGGVTRWRHRPVVAGGAAAPDRPPRVLAPELLKLVVL